MLLLLLLLLLDVVGIDNKLLLLVLVDVEVELHLHVLWVCGAERLHGRVVGLVHAQLEVLPAHLHLLRARHDVE
jgi:hypothetical protein